MTQSRGIGFDRNLRLTWLDEAALLSAEGLDPDTFRMRLIETLETEIPSHENRRKTVMLLGRIWSRSAQTFPAHHADALHLLQVIEPADRLWLHFGMTMLAYPFFRSSSASIGQLLRHRETFTRDELRRRLTGEFGELGTLPAAINRIVFSLTDWGVMQKVAGTRGDMAPLHGTLQTTRTDLQLWLLMCALTSSSKQEMLLPDLVRSPELFPFHFTVNQRDIRTAPQFEVHRQGNGWEMVAVLL